MRCRIYLNVNIEAEKPPQRWEESEVYKMVKKHVDENRVHYFSKK